MTTDSYLVIVKGAMEINPKIKEAALRTVRGGRIKDKPIALEEYPGMLVGRADNLDLQAFHFFEEHGVRYVIGPKQK